MGISTPQSTYDSSSQASAFGATANMPSITTSKIALAVSNTWNDSVNGKLIVHVAIDVQGGDADAQVQPRNLMLTMASADGAKKAYRALTQTAPISPLGNQTQTAYEADPKDDIGGLGSVIVPAHGTAHIVATFLLGGGVLANPSDNRQVSVL